MSERDFNLPEYLEIINDLQGETEREIEELSRKTKLVTWSRHYVKSMQQELLDLQNNNNHLLGELKKLTEENTALVQRLTEEKRQRTDLEMKLAEMSKLSAVMAKKASEEAVRNALQTYANTSKRKTVDKRTFAKTAILEIANVNGLTLPQDLAAIIECLDDEQPNSKVVNVAGNYNDIHDNGTVNQK